MLEPHNYGLSSRWFLRALLISLLLLASLAVVLLAGGALHWNTIVLPAGNRWLAVLFLSLAGMIFLRGFRSTEWDAFSPLRLFYTIWFGLLALGFIRLTTADSGLTVRFWTIVTCGLSAFYLGALWAGRTREKGDQVALSELARHWKIDWVPSRALLLSGAFCAVCLAAFTYEYLKTGIMPLLAEDPNSVRALFSVNSYVHRFAISFYITIQLGYIGVVHLRRYKAAFLAILVLGCVAITLLTARSFLLFAVWTAIVLFHYGRRRMTPRVALLVVLIAYPVAKLAVDVRRFYGNDAFNRVLDQIDFPERLRAFAPDYLYFSMTLQTLDHLTFIIPGEMDYQHGWYTGYPIRVFWTTRKGEGFRDRLDDLFWERSGEWSPTPAVTTAYMGVPYADFGIPGVFVFSCIFGWLSVRAYESMRRQPTFWRVFFYSQINLAIVLSIFGTYLTLFEPYWNLGVMALVHSFASGGSNLPGAAVAARLESA